MNIGQGVAILQNIYKSDADDKEKFEAIKTVLSMETHNGITKQEFINALDYVINCCGEYKQAWRAGFMRKFERRV